MSIQNKHLLQCATNQLNIAKVAEMFCQGFTVVVLTRCGTTVLNNLVNEESTLLTVLNSALSFGAFKVRVLNCVKVNA